MPALGILTPADELEYWAEVESSASQSSTRERARAFNTILQSVVKDFARLDSLQVQILIP